MSKESNTGSGYLPLDSEQENSEISLEEKLSDFINDEDIPPQSINQLLQRAPDEPHIMHKSKVKLSREEAVYLLEYHRNWFRKATPSFNEEFDDLKAQDITIQKLNKEIIDKSLEAVAAKQKGKFRLEEVGYIYNKLIPVLNKLDENYLTEHRTELTNKITDDLNKIAQKKGIFNFKILSIDHKKLDNWVEKITPEFMTVNKEFLIKDFNKKIGEHQLTEDKIENRIIKFLNTALTRNPKVAEGYFQFLTTIVRKNNEYKEEEVNERKTKYLKIEELIEIRNLNSREFDRVFFPQKEPSLLKEKKKLNDQAFVEQLQGFTKEGNLTKTSEDFATFILGEGLKRAEKTLKQGDKKAYRQRKIFNELHKVLANFDAQYLNQQSSFLALEISAKLEKFATQKGGKLFISHDTVKKVASSIKKAHELKNDQFILETIKAQCFAYQISDSEFTKRILNFVININNGKLRVNGEKIFNKHQEKLINEIEKINKSGKLNDEQRQEAITSFLTVKDKVTANNKLQDKKHHFSDKQIVKLRKLAPQLFDSQIFLKSDLEVILQRYQSRHYVDIEAPLLIKNNPSEFPETQRSASENKNDLPDSQGSLYSHKTDNEKEYDKESLNSRGSVDLESGYSSGSESLEEANTPTGLHLKDSSIETVPKRVQDQIQDINKLPGRLSFYKTLILDSNKTVKNIAELHSIMSVVELNTQSLSSYLDDTKINELSKLLHTNIGLIANHMQETEKNQQYVLLARLEARCKGYAIPLENSLLDYPGLAKIVDSVVLSMQGKQIPKGEYVAQAIEKITNSLEQDLSLSPDQRARFKEAIIGWNQADKIKSDREKYQEYLPVLNEVSTKVANSFIQDLQDNITKEVVYNSISDLIINQLRQEYKLKIPMDQQRKIRNSLSPIFLKFDKEYIENNSFQITRDISKKLADSGSKKWGWWGKFTINDEKLDQTVNEIVNNEQPNYNKFIEGMINKHIYDYALQDIDIMDRVAKFIEVNNLKDKLLNGYKSIENITTSELIELRKNNLQSFKDIVLSSTASVTNLSQIQQDIVKKKIKDKIKIMFPSSQQVSQTVASDIMAIVKQSGQEMNGQPRLSTFFPPGQNPHVNEKKISTPSPTSTSSSNGSLPSY